MPRKDSPSSRSGRDEVLIGASLPQYVKMSQRTARNDWEAIGRTAILDLLTHRTVITWFEAESRISATGWKKFPKVQPLQLHAARTQLSRAGDIVIEKTAHRLPAVTLRLPFTSGSKRSTERVRGERRKLHRKYLSWTNDQALCGSYAELVVLDSLRYAASEAGLWVPPQKPGFIDSIGDTTIQPGPLDCHAHILELPDLGSRVSLAVEVKNINSWIYPWAQELWELLVKAAQVAQSTPVLPVLVCMRSTHLTHQMAKDIGFFTAQTHDQLFNPKIPEDEFASVVDDFGLTIARHSGPLPALVNFLPRTLRANPPPSPPEEDIPWYQRQADRFQLLAPTIALFSSLATNLPDESRSSTFAAFKAAAFDTIEWPAVRGW